MNDEKKAAIRAEINSLLHEIRSSETEIITYEDGYSFPHSKILVDTSTLINLIEEIDADMAIEVDAAIDSEADKPRNKKASAIYFAAHALNKAINL